MLEGVLIVDPHNGLIEVCAHSAGDVGPDGEICGALATALMVDDFHEQKWIGRPEFAEYCFLHNQRPQWNYMVVRTE